MPKILIVEDDPKIVEAVRKTLSLEGKFALDHEANPDQAVRRAARTRPNLILLDIRLPEGDGRLIIKQLKENAATKHIPVIFLTGLSSEGDKVVGLNLGADDYLAKPFGAMELLARIKTVLRRSSSKTSQLSGSLKVRDLKLEPENRAAWLHQKPLNLQPKEFEVLYLLASNAGRTLNRTFLIENSSSYGMAVSTRSLDTHIKNIRKKLGSSGDWIQTVPKLGYRFKPGP